jgi:hypothetical protein
MPTFRAMRDALSNSGRHIEQRSTPGGRSIRSIGFAAVALVLAQPQGLVLAQTPAGPVAPAVSAVPAAIDDGGKTIWKCLGLSKQNIAGCKTKFCKSEMGGLLGNMFKPVHAVTGGLLPSCCPPPLGTPGAVPPAADLAAPGAVGAAAKIQLSEAGAKQRRAAVRYLGTVDCHYFPEAEAALINALRTDTNECVRLEAAAALARGCCCTKKTVQALNLTVTGSSSDGNPEETSERVKAIAAAALQRCMIENGELVPLPEQPEPAGEPLPEPPAGPRTSSPTMAAPAITPTAHVEPVPNQAEPAVAPPRFPTGSRSMYHILTKSLAPSPPASSSTNRSP